MATNVITKKVKARYKGNEYKITGPGGSFNLVPEQEYEIEVVSNNVNPAVEVMINEGKNSIGYPSKDKYLKQWEEIEKGKVIRMPQREQKRKKGEAISIADAGAVIYTELVSAIRRFNAKSAETYKEEPHKIPEFSITLQQQIYDTHTQENTKLYGAGVLIIEVKQFGLRRIVYQEGVSFHTKKELENVNAYAPKLYIDALNAFVESALMYILALNPDNLENAQALAENGDTKEEIPAASAPSE